MSSIREWLEAEIDEVRPAHGVRFYDRRIEGLGAVASLTDEAGRTDRDA